MKREKIAPFVIGLAGLFTTPGLSQHEDHTMHTAAAQLSKEAVSELKDTIKLYVNVSSALADDKLDTAKSAAKEVKGFSKWIQAGEKTHNPYYGSKMQTCGLQAKTI